MSGARTVAPGKVGKVGSTQFTGWGSHLAQYPVSYLTVAATIGMTQGHVDDFAQCLDKCLKDWKKKEASECYSSMQEHRSFGDYDVIRNGVESLILEDDDGYQDEYE